ncbi:hypothetical protein PHMEG_00037225, partial [Phytophthora megakarya]
MVRATRPAPPTYNNTQVSGFYFRPCRDKQDEIILEYFRCRCGTVRKQTHRNGYSNLIQHIQREHPDFEEVMLEATTAETGSFLNFVRHSSRNLYGWMVWIIQCHLPLAFCESREAHRYSKLDPFAQETLRAVMDGVMLAVERSIAYELPARFGIMLAGWMHASEHYVAVFACYKVNSCAKTTLLNMAPLLDSLKDDLSAQGHLNFLANMVSRDYGVQLGHHRLNLAVQADMAAHEDLAAVQALMIKLRTLKESAKLRLKTNLRPVIRQDNRWSSTFAMVDRYFRLL